MIGLTLKFRRQQIKMTLKMLSERTGLSIGYLSNVERELTSPTIENLQLICNAMSIDLVDVIQSMETFHYVIRHGERQVMFGQDAFVHYEMLTGDYQKIKGFTQDISAEYTGNEVSWGHEMDECGVVIEGSVDVKINDTVYTVNPGDSIYLPAHTTHSFSRPHNQEHCLIYWFRDNTRNTYLKNSECNEKNREI